MASELSMDEAHRADSEVERELRAIAARLDALVNRPRLYGTLLRCECSALAESLRAEADHIVRVWD